MRSCICCREEAALEMLVADAFVAILMDDEGKRRQVWFDVDTPWLWCQACYAMLLDNPEKVAQQMTTLAHRDSKHVPYAILLYNARIVLLALMTVCVGDAVPIPQE